MHRAVVRQLSGARYEKRGGNAFRWRGVPDLVLDRRRWLAGTLAWGSTVAFARRAWSRASPTASFPRLSLCRLPTPVERAPGLERALGVAGVWVKRDDRSADVYGGGKARKLELYLGEAKRQGRTLLVTTGAAGSNQAVASAAFAVKLGWRARLLLLPERPAAHVRSNLLACQRFGAELQSVGSQAAAAIRGERMARDEGAYVIPAGGSSPLGNVAFIEAAFELRAQIAAGVLPMPDYIYLPLGTMGSAVGLAIGAQAAGLTSRIVAVRVSSVPTSSPRALRALFEQTVRFVRNVVPSFVDVPFDPERLVIEGRYLGAGYAAPTRAGSAALATYARHFTHSLEPTYTAKTFAALLALAPDHPRATHLFWNTHSSVPIDLSGVSAASLPPALRAYFPASRRAAP